MVYILKPKFNNRNGHAIIFLLFLSIFSSTHLKFMAQGRVGISKHIHLSQEVRMTNNERRLVGSRPPRCERRCGDCGHCKAVQVPISPQFRRGKHLYAAAYSRGDDISNYKPMCWKCQCGDSFFNP